MKEEEVRAEDIKNFCSWIIKFYFISDSIGLHPATRRTFYEKLIEVLELPLPRSLSKPLIKSKRKQSAPALFIYSNWGSFQDEAKVWDFLLDKRSSRSRTRVACLKLWHQIWLFHPVKVLHGKVNKQTSTTTTTESLNRLKNSFHRASSSTLSFEFDPIFLSSTQAPRKKHIFS